MRILRLHRVLRLRRAAKAARSLVLGERSRLARPGLAGLWRRRPGLRAIVRTTTLPPGLPDPYPALDSCTDRWIPGADPELAETRTVTHGLADLGTITMLVAGLTHTSSSVVCAGTITGGIRGGEWPPGHRPGAADRFRVHSLEHSQESNFD